MAFGYKFPANGRAKESTLDEQVAKAREECVEMYREYMDMNEAAMLEEAMDTIYAVEGILRKYPKEQVAEAYGKVVQKARDRGDIKQECRLMEYQYGVYKGDEFIMVGSLEEVSEKLGVSERTIKWMASPSAKRRADKPGSKRMIVVKVEVD